MKTTVKALIESGLRRELAAAERRAEFKLRRASFGGEGLRTDVSGVRWDRLVERRSRFFSLPDAEDSKSLPRLWLIRGGLDGFGREERRIAAAVGVGGTASQGGTASAYRGHRPSLAFWRRACARRCR